MNASPLLPTGEPLYLADGGMETTMIFEHGFELPCFASFTMLESDPGREALRHYYEEYLGIARRAGAGFTLDTPTWRANPDWGAELRYSRESLAAVNRAAVELAQGFRRAHAGEEAPIAICGTVGPRGDAYEPEALMDAAAAERYHSRQIAAFAEAEVDMVAAYTLTYAEEAIGIVRAAAARGVPVAISFTLETDGRLPSGEELGAVIERVDVETGGAALYFMVNCAHPSHFAGVLEAGGAWTARLGGIRANASRKSHRELDGADQLDSGNPAELAAEYLELRPYLPAVRVLGGCCGTDSRHIAAISEAWFGAAA